MPKDEFDFDDPLELNGVALSTEEDTSRDMAECLTEEFLRMGYGHHHLLALFRNPHYLGLHMVWQNKGEAFVREVIRDVFARWGRAITWPAEATGGAPQEQIQGNPIPEANLESSTHSGDPDGAIDPLGQPAPRLNL